MTLLETPPTADANEISDKGTINRRAVLDNRKSQVNALFADELPASAGNLNHFGGIDVGLEPLAINAAVLVTCFLTLWAICLRTRDVTSVDSFWGFGMVVMAVPAICSPPAIPTASF